jgi:hypothetical protein
VFLSIQRNYRMLWVKAVFFVRGMEAILEQILCMFCAYYLLMMVTGQRVSRYQSGNHVLLLIITASACTH